MMGGPNSGKILMLLISWFCMIWMGFVAGGLREDSAVPGDRGIKTINSGVVMYLDRNCFVC